MSRLGRAAIGFAAILVAAAGAGAAWLWANPPELLRVGSGYAAKIVCSNVFLAGRDAAEVLAVDVQAPGHPLLRAITVDVNMEAGTVRSRLFGFIAEATAIYRQGTGCAVVPDSDADKARAHIAEHEAQPERDPGAPWPEGSRADEGQLPEVDAILADDSLVGPGMRAVLVIHDGRLVAERYGDGFDRNTPLLGWSMTKTVTSAIIGRLVAEGRMQWDGAALLAQWNDDRSAISIADMLGMAPGLAWNESYGDVSDVTRMLYLEGDMAAFAAAKPLAAPPSSTFNYSSGTSVILSRIWQDRVGADALSWPFEALFRPLGMASATLEADAAGTFVGSSYMYATARDWARFGQFLLQDGVWNGQRLLPEGWVTKMAIAHPASGGQYSQAHTWLRAPNEDGVSDPTALPDGSFWMSGHDGQSIAIIPAKRLVIVRLGLTPSKLGYRAGRLAAAVAATVE